MSVEIKLTSKDILEKEFKKSVKGYHIDQVDQFLDQIMEDYDAFEAAYRQLKLEVEQLRIENERLKEELVESPKKVVPQAPVQPQPSATNMNYDILKRLANLEKAVFGDKLK